MDSHLTEEHMLSYTCQTLLLLTKINRLLHEYNTELNNVVNGNITKCYELGLDIISLYDKLYRIAMDRIVSDDAKYVGHYSFIYYIPDIYKNEYEISKVSMIYKFMKNHVPTYIIKPPYISLIDLREKHLGLRW